MYLWTGLDYALTSISKLVKIPLRYAISVGDSELNLGGGGGFSRREGPSGEGTGGVSPPVGGGLGKILKK